MSKEMTDAEYEELVRKIAEDEKRKSKNERDVIEQHAREQFDAWIKDAAEASQGWQKTTILIELVPRELKEGEHGGSQVQGSPVVDVMVLRTLGSRTKVRWG
jgi:hypothetical protein